MSGSLSHIQRIFKDVELSKVELELIASVMSRVEYNKGEIIFKPGDIVNDLFHIQTGCLRTFYIDNKGKEHTLQFGIKDWWITDFTAFFTSSQAIMTLEVLEQAVLCKLSNSDREYLHENSPKFDTYIRRKLESSYAYFQKRIIADFSLSAKERYLNFKHTYSDIERKVKNYHIASYLGITTESLSRIRKEISNI